MIDLAQYFTEKQVSKMLVGEINVEFPNRILDLGVGNGSLTLAAFEKWKHASFYAVDIDSKKILNKNYPPSVIISHSNGLDYYINRKLKLPLGSVDVAICNPPYLRVKESRHYNKLLIQSGFTSRIPILTTDIIFLAQNIRFLKKGGILGIILPDGLISSHNYLQFRKDLIENHTIIAVIQLPEKVFIKTEARTHVIILQKGSTDSFSNPLVNIYDADINGNYISCMKLRAKDLIQRMDYDFHCWQSYNHLERTFASVDAKIERGRLSRKELKGLGIDHFHTTDFKKYNFEANLPQCLNAHSLVYAEEGDILVARVGSGCIGKICLVLSGTIPISDCVYKISLPKSYLQEAWNKLNSTSGQSWFKAHAHGVCSQVISKKDLFTFQF